MKFVVTAVVLIALSNAVHSTEEDNDSTEEETEKYLYTEKEFLDSVPSQPHFVMFFAPWCAHCKAMKEEWNKLAEHFNEQEPRVVTVVKVNCPDYKELCIENGVKGFPTLGLYLPGVETPASYIGERTFEALKDFVTEELQKYNEANAPAAEEEEELAKEPEVKVTEGLYDLSGMHFYRETIKGSAFVLFIQKGCEICEKVMETWKEIAKIYENKEGVKIGMVDCFEAETTCHWEYIPAFPMLKYYREYIPIDVRSITPDDTKTLKKYIDSKLSESPAELEDGFMVKMTNETIKDVISTGVTFAKLYHPSCGFCVRMARAWKELGNVDFSDAPAPVTIAEMDCEIYNVSCRENGGRGYPTLLAYMDGEVVASYDGPRTVAEMKHFVYELANGYHPRDRVAEELVVTDGLYNLADMEFFRATMKGTSFILFARQNCEYCQKVTVAWKEVAKYYENDKDVKIGIVYCSGKSDFCTSRGVRAFPLVKFYRDGNEIEGSAITPDVENVKAYIRRKLLESEASTAEVERGIIEMTDNTIKDVISKGVTFVKFYVPGCGFCKRMARAWEKLGEKDFSEASGPVTIAEMDCSKYVEVCRENGSRGFPSLVLFIDGKIAARYGSIAPRSAEAMYSFVLDMTNDYHHGDHHRDEL